jgi:hypothetical protein
VAVALTSAPPVVVLVLFAVAEAAPPGPELKEPPPPVAMLMLLTAFAPVNAIEAFAAPLAGDVAAFPAAPPVAVLVPVKYEL